MSTPLTRDARSRVPDSVWLDALAAWVLLAAVGQLCYLAYWPVYVLGVPVPQPAAAALALVRIGIYGGIGAGLLARLPTAWAGTVIELARTFVLFALTAFRSEPSLVNAVFPAGWTQGLLSAVMPVILGLNTALACGWRPRRSLEPDVAAAARVLAALCGVACLGLRRKSAAFGGAAAAPWKTLWTRGLPPALLLTAADGAALWVALHGIPGNG